MLVHSVSEGDGIGDCVGVRELARVLLSEGLTWCVCVCVILRETGSVFSMQRAKASTSTFSRTLFPAKLSN